MPKSREEILAHKREAQRRKREEIKKDAALYEEKKKKDRDRYYRLKAEKKVLPLKELSSARRNEIRQRNRENSRAHYLRKKLKGALETIEKESMSKNESELSIDIQQNENNDLLVPISSKVTPSKYKLRSAGKKRTQDNVSEEVNNIAISEKESFVLVVLNQEEADKLVESEQVISPASFKSREDDDIHSQHSDDPLSAAKSPTGREAKIQWKKLRDSHREALRRRKPSSGPSALNLKPWKYEEDMKFLSQTEKTKEPSLISNDSNDTLDSDNAENNSSQISIPEPVLTIPYSDPLNSVSDLREERARERREMRMREIDSHRNDGLAKLFDSFYQKTRELPKYLQLRVQREIFASISRAEEEALNMNPEPLVGYSLASSSSHGYNNSSSIDKETDYSATEYENKFIRRSVDY